MTDHADFFDLHAFRRDLLYTVRKLERDGGAPKGTAIKRDLETQYDEEINHSRLYQNLDGLEERGLIEKGQKDDRTNEYATTDTARDLLEDRVNQRVRQVGLPNAKASGDADCWPDADRPTPDPEAMTVLLDGDPLDPVEVGDGHGTWTDDTNDTSLRVTLRWTDRIFSHASARVDPDGRDEFVPLRRTSPCTPPTAPVFTPASDAYDFEIELVPDQREDGDAA